jgi:hypothetical protein
MNVVRHQAIRPQLHLVSGGLPGEQIEADGLIALLEEDRLTPVSALGDMVSPSWNNDILASGGIGRR